MTGWAVVTFDGPPRFASAGTLRTDTSASLAERLLSLRAGLRDVLAREAPDAAAIERVFSGVNPQSLITLGEARGVLLVTLAEHGLHPAEISPAEIKKAVTGTGLAEKDQVRRMVAAFLGRPPSGRLGLDAADAAAAALAHGLVVTRRAPVLLAEAGVPASRTVRRRPLG